MAALLDELQIDKVVAYGTSGGGPAALEFAIRHSERTKAVLLECAVTGSYKYPGTEEVKTATAAFMLTSPSMARLKAWMATRYPESVFKGAMEKLSTFTPEEIDSAAA